MRVFTCSMSDFWHEGTPHLTYQVLSKRPGNIDYIERRVQPFQWHALRP
jgi:hypothetical protein